MKKRRRRSRRRKSRRRRRRWWKRTLRLVMTGTCRRVTPVVLGEGSRLNGQREPFSKPPPPVEVA
jgi:hypothetical protein